MLIRNDILLIDTPVEWISMLIDTITSDDTDIHVSASGVGLKGITSITLDCLSYSETNGSICAINWAASNVEMKFENNEWGDINGFIGIRSAMKVISEKKGVSRIVLLFPPSVIYYPDSEEFELVKTFLDVWAI